MKNTLEDTINKVDTKRNKVDAKIKCTTGLL